MSKAAFVDDDDDYEGEVGVECARTREKNVEALLLGSYIVARIQR